MSAEFDWQNAYLKEHDDLCAVEGRNYLLEQRIKALEAANLALNFGLREIIDADMRGEFSKMVEIAQAALSEVRKALGEGKP